MRGDDAQQRHGPTNTLGSAGRRTQGFAFRAGGCHRRPRSHSKVHIVRHKRRQRPVAGHRSALGPFAFTPPASTKVHIMDQTATRRAPRRTRMDTGMWATWYDVDDSARDEHLAWLHGEYLPWLRQRPGFAWVAHYVNEGGGH